MKLRELEIGKIFLFADPNTRCTEIYKKKRILKGSDYCIVGIPDAYDEFAVSLDTDIIAE